MNGGNIDSLYFIRPLYWGKFIECQNKLTPLWVNASKDRNALTPLWVNTSKDRNALTPLWVNASENRNTLTPLWVNASKDRNALTPLWVNASEDRNALTPLWVNASEDRTVPAHANPNYTTSPGNETTDKIFLLSIVEAEEYFTSDDDRRAAATPYAQFEAAYVFSYKDFQISSLWWLRSPGSFFDNAAYVDDEGSISRYGADVFHKGIAVRPAFWVNL